MSTKGSILLIAYYWPPAGGVMVQRWLHMSRELAEMGWDITVCTSANPDYPQTDEALGKFVHPTIDVITCKGFEPRLWLKKIAGYSGKKQISGDQHLDAKSTENSGWIQRVILWIRSNLFIPDARVYWAKSTINTLKKVFKDRTRPDIIITTGPPHSTHLGGMALSQYWGCKWMVDFRDPWMEIEYFNQLNLTTSSREKHRSLEREVLTRADLVVTVSPSWKTLLESKGAGHTAVIYNGYAEEDFKEPPPHALAGFSMVYTGTLGSDRSSGYFLEVIQSLMEEYKEFKEVFSMHLAGHIHPDILAEFKRIISPGKLHNHGIISHEKSISLMRSASVLWLIQNDVLDNIAGRIPAKFFEYLATGKPVLLIGSRDSDLGLMIEGGGYGLVADMHDREDIHKKVLLLWENYKGSVKSVAGNDIKLFSRKRQSLVLNRLLEELIE